MKTRTGRQCLYIAFLSAAACVHAHAQLLSIQRLGYYDIDHQRTSDRNAVGSGMVAATSTHFVTGFSHRYIQDGYSGGTSGWFFHPALGMRRVGLIDSAHIRDDTYQWSVPSRINASGIVAGHSEKYREHTLTGQSAWVYHPGTDQTTDLTLRDALHSDGGGYQSSTIRALNSAGHIAGTSFQYNGWTLDGQTAWLYRHGQPREILGLRGGEYARANGMSNSVIFGLNDAGYVAGTSTRYSPSGEGLGPSAWIYSPGGVTTRVGLYDADHTRTNGRIDNQVRGLSASGTVLGTAPRYRGGLSEANLSVWHADAAGTTTRIGLLNAEHTATDGTQQSDAFTMTSSGYAAGRSRRFEGTTVRGWSAWVYRPDVGHRRVGLTDAEHTRLNGSRISEFAAVNNAGQVLGTSNRYSAMPDAQIGVSAFFDSPSTGSVRIGLFDAQHTRADNLREVDSLSLTDEGLATGRSRRYIGSANRGWSAWMYREDIGTRRLGLTGSAFIHPDGSMESAITGVSGGDFIIGTSRTYGDFGGAIDPPRRGWFHDVATNTTYDIPVGTASDGYTYALPQLVTPSGLVYGRYRDVSSTGELLGYYAFVWSRTMGFTPMHELVLGGVPSGGVSGVRDTLFADELRFIVGQANIDDLPGGGIYAMIPGPAGLLSLLAAGAVMRRRR